MKRRRKGVREKVVEMRVILGSRKEVVRFMEAASVSSLKRWERRQCNPLRAHHQLVYSKHREAKKVKKAVKGLLAKQLRVQRNKHRR